ncbi:MAG: hypothetical protein E7517_06070 [Ruminococcaceae bacterium]|nr:hypothetical protein [Oscillospiraceae bacterium]
MFGYVKADLNKLSEENAADYRAVYCTLCRSLKTHYGFTARYLLNYDITFLALLKLSMTDGQQETCEHYCPYRAKKCLMLGSAQDVFFECASILIVLTYEKLLDNVRDEKFIKKWFYAFLARLFRAKYRKAKAHYPDISDKIRQNMILQEDYEANFVGIDKAAHPSADALGYLFAHGSDNQQLYRFGYYLGRWIYFADAADDLPKDAKSGSFNPFKNGYDTQRIQEVLNLSIGEAAQAFTSLPILHYTGILQNIIYEGSFAVQQNILKGDSK